MQIKNTVLLKNLEKSGFNDKEALIYLSVLELGGAYPSRIAEYAGLNRSTTYKILLNLSIRNLINEIEKKNKIYYQIENPSKVLRYTQNKIQQAENSVDEIKRILPDLEGLFEAAQNRPKITYFDQKEGILSIFTDMITNQKPYEMVAFSAAGKLIDFIPNDFYANYTKNKVRLGITTRAIVPDSEHDRRFNEIIYNNFDKKFIPEFKYMHSSRFFSSSEITVYGTNRVSIINFDKNKLSGIIIEDSSIHDMIKTIFELSWNSVDVRK